MKFIKGMMFGTAISAGVMMMLVDTKNTRNMMKRKGKKALNRMKYMY